MLNLYRTPRPNQDLADHLDYTQNDDRIIGHLAQFREENPSADARLFTGDSGPYVKAGHFGIPREFIPDDWRLTPEPDDRQRKLQELTKQIEELQAQEPKFNFSYAQQSEARPRHIEIAYPAFLPLTAIEREQLLERLRELYPPTVVNRDSISVQSISEYEERDHPAWMSECEEVLDWVHYIVQLERCAELTVTIQNTGSRPATNALVDICASGHFGLTSPIRELKEFGLIPVVARPGPPPQPQPPASWSTIINDLTTPIDLPLVPCQSGFVG